MTPNDVGDADVSGAGAGQGANNLENYPVLGVRRQRYTGNHRWLAQQQVGPHLPHRVLRVGRGRLDGVGEGQRYLGFVTVTTDGSGNAAFATTLTAGSRCRGRVRQRDGHRPDDKRHLASFAANVTAPPAARSRHDP